MKESKCRTCGLEQEEQEFYIKDRKTGRLATQCRDCEILKKGAKEVGKTRKAMRLFKRGLRKCLNCKSTKPLPEFPPNQSCYGGLDNRCHICRKEELIELCKKRR